MTRPARAARTALVSLALAAACTSPPGSPAGGGHPSTGPAELVEPYPFTTPTPARTPTEIDGIYLRIVSLARAGGPPVPCRRCAPYRLDAGSATLTLDRGVFFIHHRLTGFRSIGHYVVEGGRVELFNDPNCTTERGVYAWELDGRSLRLTLVSDGCAFSDLRAVDLTAEPWTLVTEPCYLDEAWPEPSGCDVDHP